MIVLNNLHHSDEQWAALTKEPDEGPIFMVNLFKFREHAEYRRTQDQFDRNRSIPTLRTGHR